jgi:hypothetical protein
MQSLKNARVAAKFVAILIACGLLTIACGGSDAASGTSASPAGTDADAATAETDSGQAATADDQAVESGSAADSTAEQESGDGAAPDAVINPEIGVGDPHEVAVLQVREDVQIVPVFDGPDGNEVQLFDLNPIDGTELEYPLFATTEFGNPLALLVVEYDETAAWAKVQVPIRPNNSTAWVETANFAEQRHNFRIEVSLSENQLTLFQGETVILEQATVTGSPDLPTPVGRTYIDEKVPGESVDPGFGDWILSLSAFSEVLGTAGGGGLPKLAIHGTNQPELMGQSVSSGSIRVPNEVISILAETAPIGTVVDIAP